MRTKVQTNFFDDRMCRVKRNIRRQIVEDFKTFIEFFCVFGRNNLYFTKRSVARFRYARLKNNSATVVRTNPSKDRIRDPVAGATDWWRHETTGECQRNKQRPIREFRSNTTVVIRLTKLNLKKKNP